MNKHSKLILQINKALSILSQKVYVDVLSEIDPSDDYSLIELLKKCKENLSKIDENYLTKIANAIQKPVNNK